MSRLVQSDSGRCHRKPLRVYVRQTNVKSLATLAVVGAGLLCIGGLVLVVGLGFGAGLLNQCENKCSVSGLWVAAFAVPGVILAGIGLLLLLAALVRGLRRS